MTPSLINKGSEWRKWDLHVHTPASHGFTGTWEQFEQQLVTADCDVIGINDYCSIAGYKLIKGKIANGSLDIGHRKILPVVEFRMRDVLKNKHTGTSGTNINFHIIFDDSIPIEKLETFIKSLEVDDCQIADKYSNAQFLQENVKIYFKKDVVDKLNANPDFRDKFIVWLPYDEYGGIDDIDPETDDWIKRGFVKYSDILGSSNKKQIDFFLWKSSANEDGTVKFSQGQFEEWFKTKKPCIKGSDSHKHDYPIGKLKDADSNPVEKYCWIKADPTFEGIKQVVFDPESRVYIGEHPPVSPTNTIQSLSYGIPDTATIKVEQSDGSEKEETFCFAGINSTYHLSPFFNCFIGGRGSGKSTVLNFLGQHSKNPSSSDNFWRKLRPSFNPKDQNIFSFDGVEHFEFIGQSEVESFATNKDAFTSAIYERANILSGGNLYEKAEEQSVLLASIGDFKSLIVSLESLRNEQMEKGKEKRTLEQSIKITTSTEYSEIVSQITDKSNDKQYLQKWRVAVEDLRSSINQLEDVNANSSDEPPQEIDISNIENGTEKTESSAVEVEDIALPYKQAYQSAKSNISLAFSALDPQKFLMTLEKENALATKIEEHEKELSNLLEKAGLSPENILQVKSAPQKLVKLEDELAKVKKKIDETEARIKEYPDVLKKTQDGKIAYESVIQGSVNPLVKTLEEQSKENEGKDVKNIGLSYFFDESAAWLDIAQQFYSCFPNYHDGERAEDIKDHILKNKAIFCSDYVTICTHLESLTGNQKYAVFLKEIFKNETNFKIFCAIRDQHLNDVLQYKQIQVLYDGKDIERASFGQKCTAVIVILLLFGNYPLIIDEPEAHLDSSLIANYLVPLIKKKKTNRQIIFATHNANFVVNGDAEKIFILNNETGKTTFIETTIENLDHREELLKLEGGREAFRKRGEKLHI